MAHNDVPGLSVAVTCTAPVCIPTWPNGSSFCTLCKYFACSWDCCGVALALPEVMKTLNLATGWCNLCNRQSYSQWRFHRVISRESFSNAGCTFQMQGAHSKQESLQQMNQGSMRRWREAVPSITNGPVTPQFSFTEREKQARRKKRGSYLTLSYGKKMEVGWDTYLYYFA